jgi:mono/diheme cytochrome c family protein
MKTKAVIRIAFVLAALVLGIAGVSAGQNDVTSQVERGKWLVNLGGCHDCHSPKVLSPAGPVPDESRLLSGAPAHTPVPEIPEGTTTMDPNGWGVLTNLDLTAWAGPWGVSFPANLTPDVETGLGSWTEEMFMKAIRTGKHMGEGRPILPPMPWQNFALLEDENLKAIFAYLRSLPAIKNAVPEPIPPKTADPQ